MRNFYQRGVTSVMVLLLMFVALTVMLSLASLSMGTLKRSSNERDMSLAFNVAQATLEFQVAVSYELAKKTNGNFSSMDVNLTDVADSMTPGAQAYVEIQVTADPKTAWFTSYGMYAGKRTSVRALVSSRDVSIWNNAIFAGSGTAGQAISGNVDIRGSMHILGEGEPYSDLNGNGQRDEAEVFSDDNGNGVWDPGEDWVDTNSDGVWNSAEPFNDSNWNGMYDAPITTTELSSSFGGEAHIGNNYYGMPIGLEAMVPALPLKNGMETLSAEVRVKHGQISMSGGATIGDEYDPDAGMSKGKLDGSFVSDGYTGNQGDSLVYSDNGTNLGYDINHLDIKFPYLDGIGADEYIDENGVAWENTAMYLNANSMTVPLNFLDKDTLAFDFSDDQGNRIRYTPGGPFNADGFRNPPAELRIEGIVKIEGSLEIVRHQFGQLRYRGKGSLYVTEDINLHVDVLPQEGLVFPLDTSLGLIAGRDINLATGSGDSQLAMAGAFYAQGTIRSAKQNEIAGTFVSNYFDMGKNVPNIYQVPTLADNLPPGMPGNKKFFTVKYRSWRSRKLTNVPIMVYGG